MHSINLVHLNPRSLEQVKKQGGGILCYPAPEGGYFLSKLSFQNLKKAKIPHEYVQSFELEDAGVELIYPARSRLFEPPPLDAIQEAAAYALSRKGKAAKTQLIYEGRHLEPRPSKLGPDYFYRDRPQGKRSYLWRSPRKPEKIADIRRMFPRLRRRIQDPDTRVVLSFGSGGVRLYAHPALMKWVDLMGVRDQVDEIWGCSGGAIAGMPYSLGIDPTLIEEEGYHLYNHRYAIRWSPHAFEVLKNILVDNFFPNSDNMLQGFLDCQEDLRQVFGKYIACYDSIEAKIPFYCTAYNIKEKRLEILTPQRMHEPSYPIPIFHAAAMEAVIASSSIPILYVPKRILRGKTEQVYVDGGTIEELPLFSVYQKWREDRRRGKEPRKKLLILGVNLFPRFESHAFFTHWLVRRLPTSRIFHLFVRYTDMVRQARIEEHLNLLKHHPDVEVIELKLPLKDQSVLDPHLIPQIIKTAQQSFLSQLLDLEKKLPQAGGVRRKSRGRT